jgi:hypothetical protein
VAARQQRLAETSRSVSSESAGCLELCCVRVRSTTLPYIHTSLFPSTLFDLQRRHYNIGNAYTEAQKRERQSEEVQFSARTANRHRRGSACTKTHGTTKKGTMKKGTTHLIKQRITKCRTRRAMKHRTENHTEPRNIRNTKMYGGNCACIQLNIAYCNSILQWYKLIY